MRAREAHTSEGDAIAAAHRRLPRVEMDGATPIRERGAVTRLDAFRGDVGGLADRLAAGDIMDTLRANGRATQWARLNAGYSDDLGTGRR